MNVAQMAAYMDLASTRARLVSTIARQRGLWGLEHANRVLLWAEHLRRPRNSASLASTLFAFRDAQWLEKCRTNPDMGGYRRPGTRQEAGPVCRRWDEALDDARAYAESFQQF